jgi:hypothetical protein
MGSKAREKAPTNMWIKYDGTTKFTVTVGIIPDQVGGSGYDDTKTQLEAMVGFPWTFPLAFGGATEERAKFSMRGMGVQKFETIQPTFKMYRTNEKFRCRGYQLRAIIKGDIR